MIWVVALFLAKGVVALPVSEVPAKVSCEKSVKDFTYDCAEIRAREACVRHDEDFDQCVQEFSGKYFRRCSKSLAKLWCKRCAKSGSKSPSGCQSIDQKPLKKARKSEPTKSR